MSGLIVTPRLVEQWRSRALQILHEIETLRSEGRKPDLPDGLHDATSAKISELRAELKAIQFDLLRATYVHGLDS